MSRLTQIAIVLVALISAAGIVRAAERFHLSDASQPIRLPPIEAPGELPPPLPADPYVEDIDQLPPLEEELFYHGGSYLYQPEGDHLGWPAEGEPSHHQRLRLPEWYIEPQPLTHFAPFEGTGPILAQRWKWPGSDGYYWEPRFVGHGSYQLFGFALEQNNQRQDVIGHQLLVDLDLRLTGTERFHVQFRPVGEKDTGGSYFRFNSPSGYVDNSTGVPDRYWFECEIGSVLGAWFDPDMARDYNLVAGKFPYALHNQLLMNDDVIGLVLSKNNVYLGRLSNFNWQFFAAFADVDAYTDADAGVYGTHLIWDRRHNYYEATYAFLQHDDDSRRDAHYAAISRTSNWKVWNYAARAFFRWSQPGGGGDSQLYVLESNRYRYFDGKPLGIESGTFYANAFYATAGWSPISGGNFNRLRLAFESNPLIQIAAAPPVDGTYGLALGVRLFRHNQDEAIIPEFAWQAPDGTSVWGFGLRYQRKTGPRSFFELLGILNYSDDAQHEREGVFLSETILF